MIPTAKAVETVPVDVKFELDIEPILTARGCNSGPCHGKARGQNGFALSLLGFDSGMDYDSIIHNAKGRRVAFSNPSQSILLLKAIGKLPHGGGVRIEEGDEDYKLLVDWVRKGAPRVTSDDKTLASVEIQPAPHPMAAGQEESLKVVATYSDGSQRVVTNTCAYQSNEPAVISVSAQGKLKAGQLPGEATIMARYMGMIATWSTAVPRAEKIADEVYSQLPRTNFIDEHVYRKLSELNIQPSKPCSDGQYMRRVYLDAIGRLPTPDEARTFLNDTDPNKRSSLVDKLLDRSEYADFWANKWEDLLRPNPYRVGIKATFNLDDWIRDAYRRNLPYDQFVYNLLTAQGSTWKNGAVTVFRDRREPEEITTMVSQLFMGVRLECAKCHQHPFEVYSQRDFYSLASFFSRVGYKGTGLSPPISGSEEMVFVKKQGSVKHPITQEVLAPKFLLDAVPEIDDETDPRAVLADWLRSEGNRYFARVAVNRIWSEVMGIGIVDPVDDLRATNPPSNPALMDALADHFREVGFDNKKLLRTIFASQIYALSSSPNSTNAADYRNFSRHYRKRLRGEVLADAISDITEVPENYDRLPSGTRAVQLWTHRIPSDFLDTFGRPDPNQDPPCERTPDATMVQALHVMNAPDVHARLTSDKGRCQRLAESKLSPNEIIEELYLAVFNRQPREAELQSLVAEFNKPDTNRRRLIEDILWSLLNSPEFIYND